MQWAAAVGRQLNHIRREERAEILQMRTDICEHNERAKNPAAFARYVLYGEEAGSFASVIDSRNGCFKTSAEEIKDVLYAHYPSVFAATARTSPQPK